MGCRKNLGERVGERMLRWYGQVIRVNETRRAKKDRVNCSVINFVEDRKVNGSIAPHAAQGSGELV